MRAKHHKTMEHMDEDSVMAYLRAGLQGAMQTDTADAVLRQNVLLRLVQEGSQGSSGARPSRVPTSSGGAEQGEASLTREALLAAATPACGTSPRAFGSQGGPPGLAGRGTFVGHDPRDHGSGQGLGAFHLPRPNAHDPREEQGRGLMGEGQDPESMDEARSVDLAGRHAQAMIEHLSAQSALL